MTRAATQAEQNPALYAESLRARLLRTARGALENCLQRRETHEKAVEHAVQHGLASAGGAEQAQLLAERAAFVTLWRRDTGDLRGCRGECAAHQPLIAAVAWMALAAATDDPRFAPVTPAEISLLRIEINVLSPLVMIEPQEVRVGIDGLMVIRERGRGLLLPQVAVEHAMTREQFLDAVCGKAGLSEHAWHSPGTSLWAFQTESWEEE